MHDSHLRILIRNPRFILGAMVLGIFTLCALFAPWLSPHDLTESDFMDRLCSPSSEHLLGCDLYGNDILTVMLYGARASLYVGSLTVILSVFIGISVGLISGYFSGWLDGLLMRIVDIFMAFPGILLAMSLTALLGPSQSTIIFSIAATGWTSAARLVRAQVLSVREREFVLAAKAIGASSWSQMFKHILPQTLSSLFVHASFSLSGVIIIEAGLSYLGLGAQDADMTWGALLSQGSEILLTKAPSLTLIPGSAIFILVISLNLLGDALRDTYDPKSESISQ